MDNSQYLQMFFDESAEYLQQLNENVLLLENHPDDEEIINSVFRAAHSVKGMSATMGFNKLTDLTHKIENILAKVRNKEMKINENIIDLLFNGLDYIKTLLDDIKSDGEEATNISNYLISLDKCLSNPAIEETSIEEEIAAQREFSSYLVLSDEEETKLASKMKATDYIHQIEVRLKRDCLLKNVRGYMILKKAQELGYLVKSNPSLKEIEDEDFGFSIYILLVSSLEEDKLKEELEDIIDVELVNTGVMEFNKENQDKEEEKADDQQDK
ncbi:MAG TPA: Hpt domain-containing protein, partial [Halanaerobiales bacterium]|nr:Hpt domain-containing protein [Halanaerobiales bacterium]